MDDPIPLKGLPILLAVSAGSQVAAHERQGAVDLLTIDFAGETGIVSLEVPLGDAVGYWHPNLGALRSIVPDWQGDETTSLVASTPLGSLYDSTGNSILTFATDGQISEAKVRFGVSEERKAFVVQIEKSFGRGRRTLRLALVNQPVVYHDAIDIVREWSAATLSDPVLPAAPGGIEPVYSTWYAFSQAITDDTILREARIAADLGCRLVFLDDGWQRHGDGRWYEGCGDWVPDVEKFADLRGFVDELRARGMGVVLWVAPLLVGEASDVFADLKQFASHRSETLRTRVVDPRHVVVREWIVRTCVRLLVDYDLDGLKIDFLDEAMAYAGDGLVLADEGFIADVGEAMYELLRDLHVALARVGRADALIEFRQPYVGPAVAAFGNLVRANDCPADGVVNRRSIIDARLATASAAVHSDPMMWGSDASVETVARQLLNGMFGVPQVSMRLTELSEEHRETVKAYLTFWCQERHLLLRGRIDPGLPVENYPVIEAAVDGRRIVAAYQSRVLDLHEVVGALLVVNATPGSSLVARWSRAQMLDAEIRDARGLLVEVSRIAMEPGLVELLIPSGGIATYRVVETDDGR